MAIGTLEGHKAGRKPSLRQRLASGAVVLLLHIVLALSLVGVVAVTPPEAPEFVFTLVTVRPPPQPAAPVPPPDAEAPSETPRLADVPPPLPQAPSPPSPVWTGPPAQPQPDLAGIGQSLFGCRIENLAALTPEQRAKCSNAGFGVPPDEASLAAVAQFEARQNLAFARALLQKQGALLLPCVSRKGHPIKLVDGPNVAGITLFSFGGSSGGTLDCLADGLVNGFDSDDQDVYQREPDE